MSIHYASSKQSLIFITFVVLPKICPNNIQNHKRLHLIPCAITKCELKGCNWGTECTLLIITQLKYLWFIVQTKQIHFIAMNVSAYISRRKTIIDRFDEIFIFTTTMQGVWFKFSWVFVSKIVWLISICSSCVHIVTYCLVLLTLLLHLVFSAKVLRTSMIHS